MLKKSLIATLILSGISTTILSADEFSKFLNYETGDVITNYNEYKKPIYKNDEYIKKEKTKENGTIIEKLKEKFKKISKKFLNSDDKETKKIIKTINADDEDDFVNETTFSNKKETLINNIYSYFIKGKYNKDNTQNKKDIYVFGIYDSIYYPEINHLYEFDIEKTIIKKENSEDIKQTDFTFTANIYQKNNFINRLSLHYLQDNKDTKVFAGQYKIAKNFYNGINKKYTPYVKLSYEKYRHYSEKGLVYNHIIGIKPGLVLTLYNQLNSLSFYTEARYHKQIKNKFKNSRSFYGGIKVGLSYLNTKNKFDINYLYSNEVGTIMNDGFVVGNSTDQIKHQFEMSDTYYINKHNNIKLTYKNINYIDINYNKQNNLNLIGIMYGYQF